MRRFIQLLTLHCVLVATEEGSLLRASRWLQMHKSFLSRRVRELELTLGVTLFDRHVCGVRQTAAGERSLANLSLLTEVVPSSSGGFAAQSYFFRSDKKLVEV